MDCFWERHNAVVIGLTKKKQTWDIVFKAQNIVKKQSILLHRGDYRVGQYYKHV